ncbi:MAG: OmpA family protein [Myxococcota bacterium]
MVWRALPLWLLLMALPAVADEAVSVELVPKALAGAGQPAIVVHAMEPIARLVLDLSDAAGARKIHLEAKNLGAGKVQRFALDLGKPSRAALSGILAVKTAAGGTAEMPIQVEVELVAPLEVKVAPEDVDLEKKRLRVTTSRPVRRLEALLLSDTGAALGTPEARFDSPTSEPVIEWQEAGTILKISVKAYDVDEFFGGVDLFPWRVDIPHEELNFATGSHDIEKAEVQKLDASFALIQQAVARYGKLATIRLFIAGHTDTVGDAASNRALSERRALSIGRWFKKRGVKVPILAAGFGEDVPLVQTPDQTDEPRNRRAEYIVAVEAPTIRGRSPWQPVP